MATLSAIEFPTVDGADRALAILEDLQKQRLITLHDAAVVTWPPDKKQPKTRQANSLVGAGALGGMFWGMLFGLLFFVPVLGLAIGAGIGALTGALTDVGIDDKFINQVKQQVDGAIGHFVNRHAHRGEWRIEVVGEFAVVEGH